MRSKLFSILMALMLLPSMAFALTYDEAKTAISSFNFRQWPNVANCNAELEIDDVVVDYATTNYTVMAYVNGTLRGYQNTARSQVPATGGPAHYIYTTDVWANTATETGEEITFYVLDEAAKKVYQAVHSHAWAEGTLEMPSSGGKIVVSTKVLVEEIVTTDSTVFATEVDASLFPSSNYAAMYNWCVELTPYYTVLPEDATDRSVYITWDYTSNDYAVERASNDKWYMFVAAGGTYTATIHAYDRSAASADLTLTVKIPVTDITPYNPETVFRQDIITGGYDVKRKFTVYPDIATDKSVTYSLVSAKTTCAGTLTGSVFKPAANGKGEVYVKITSVSNPDVSAEYHFTVKVKVEDLVLANNTATINVGDVEDMTSWYSITPSDAEGEVTATSGDASIAKVEKVGGVWKITGVAPGDARITFTVPTGEMEVTGAPVTISKTMTVTVVQPVESITISPKLQPEDFIVWRKYAQTGPYEIIKNVHYFVNPSNATNTAVTMSFVSGYENMGTLTEAASFAGYTFKPAADKKGEVKIKIASVENPAISTILTLTVKVAVESLVIDPASVTVPVGTVVDVADYVTVLPADADDKSILVADISAKGNGTLSGTKFTTTSAGTTTLQVSSNQNPNEANGTFTIDIRPYATSFTVELDASNDDTIGAGGAKLYRIPMYTTRTVTITPVPAGSFFKNLDCEVNFNLMGATNCPASWTAGTYTAIEDNRDGTFSFTITPYMPNQTYFRVFDDDLNLESRIDFEACAVAELGAGWTWMSTLSNNTDNSYGMLQAFGDNLIEARTESLYLVNDPTYGYFGGYNNSGDIPLNFGIDGSHFRVKLQKPVSYYDSKYNPATAGAHFLESFNVHKGWNWVHSMSFYPVPISCLADGTEGDMIKSKDGATATFSSGAWHGTLTALTPNAGFAYLSNNASDATISLKEQPAQPTSKAWAPRHAEGMRHWSYDGSRFMTNMVIIADLPQMDDPEMYTIGTFVNGECRGEGKYVDDRWFIFAHGEAGDQVTFQIKNMHTDQIFVINEIVDFDEIRGSFAEPMRLSAGNGTTAIEDIVCDGNVNVIGNIVLGEGAEIFDINGRNLTNANGRLMPGMYIVKSNGIIRKVNIK